MSGQNLRNPVEVSVRNLQRLEVKIVLMSALATLEFLSQRL